MLLKVMWLDLVMGKGAAEPGRRPTKSHRIGSGFYVVWDRISWWKAFDCRISRFWQRQQYRYFALPLLWRDFKFFHREASSKIFCGDYRTAWVRFYAPMEARRASASNWLKR